VYCCGRGLDCVGESAVGSALFGAGVGGPVLYLNCEQRALPWALLVHTGAVSAMATSR
jgi:hypothetical protein